MDISETRVLGRLRRAQRNDETELVLPDNSASESPLGIFVKISLRVVVKSHLSSARWKGCLPSRE